MRRTPQEERDRQSEQLEAWQNGVMKNSGLLIVFLLGICTFESPAQTTWRVAPGRSSIQFTVKHLVLLDVEGKFRKFEGTVVTQDESFMNARIDATIYVESIYTGNQDRDKDLLGEDFFSAEKFPTISFTSRSVTKTGNDSYKITGNLTIRDVTKSIELVARYIDRKELSTREERMDISVTGSLNRFDYGLRWNALTETGSVIVGETVDLRLNIALLKGE